MTLIADAMISDSTINILEERAVHINVVSILH